MKWKKYLLISISLVVLFFSKEILRACAGMYYEFYSSTVFFENSTPDKPAYKPFYFTMHNEYYDQDYWRDESSADKVNKQAILAEWVDFFDHQFSKQEIAPLLYNADSLNIFKLLKRGESITKANAFSTYLTQPQHAEILNYLIYAKACEVNANRSANLWPEEKTQPTTSNAELQNNGLTALEKVDNPFLRMKYAFQVVRLGFYDQNYTQVLQLYNRLVGAKKDSSVAFTRLLGFKAGAYYHTNRKIKAGYYYAKMFATNRAYKLDALKSFQWSISEKTTQETQAQFQAVYHLCQSDKERAIVLEMKVLHSPQLALDKVAKIYALYPEIDGFKVLVNREINKLEYFYFSRRITLKKQLTLGDRSVKAKQDLAELNNKYSPYISDLNAFLDQLIAGKQPKKASFWYLTKAYLATMQQRNAATKRNLSAAKRAGMSDHEKALYQRIDLLHTLFKTSKITPKTERILLPKLKALEALAHSHDKDKNFATEQFKDVMTNIIAQKYLKQGDTIKSIYAMAHSQIYSDYYYASHSFNDAPGNLLNAMSPSALKKVIRYRESTPESAYEAWLIQPTYYTADVLKELLATNYIRQQKFHLAAEVLRTTEITETYSNPFMPRINDRVDVGQTRTYTKLSYSSRMGELKDIIQKNPDDAGALYGYALALYNTSYYGPSWRITEYFRGSTDDNAYYKRSWVDQQLPDYKQNYYRLYNAEKYFLKTYKAAESPELKAKALWGAAKCWQKRAPLTKTDLDEYELKYNYVWGHQDEYYQHSLNNPYFEKLKAHYLTTDFVNSARHKCDYFEDYL